MDEPDPTNAFSMKTRPGWSNAKYDILKKELKFLKLNREYLVAPSEY